MNPNGNGFTNGSGLLSNDIHNQNQNNSSFSSSSSSHGHSNDRQQRQDHNRRQLHLHHHHHRHHPSNRRRYDGCTKSAVILKGAMIFHRIGEYAVLAVILMAMFSFLSVSGLPRIITAGAFSPTTAIGSSSTSRITTQGSASASRSARSPLHKPSTAAATATTTAVTAATTRLTPLRVSTSPPPTSSSKTTPASSGIPRLDPSHLQTLREDGYVIVDDFLDSESWMEELREDVLHLRKQTKFKTARIGQDSTNALNEEIRVAETCFLGRDKPELKNVPSAARERLYDVLETLRRDLQESGSSESSSGSRSRSALDPNLSEFLYAYYPRGGFYRRHRDAVRGSASWLREYSLLLYLNEESHDPDIDGGRLRVHFDSGGDFLPAGEAPLFQDVDAYGGTLVIFESDRFPHEVLDTVAERFAVVGWYNRPMTLSDLSAINNNDNGGGGGGGGLGDPVRLVALAVAAGLVTVGLLNILAS